MEIEKKQLLKKFLLVFIPIEMFLILIAITAFYLEVYGTAEALAQFEHQRIIYLLIPVIFALLATLWFFVIWKWKSQKK